MVHLFTLEKMMKNYEKNRDVILSSDKRFAVVNTSSIQYFSTRSELYSAYPDFHPDAQMRFGTSPLLIDIGKETNSIDYQREVLESKRDKAQKDLSDALKGLSKLGE